MTNWKQYRRRRGIKKCSLRPILGAFICLSLVLQTITPCRAENSSEEETIRYLKKLSLADLLEIEVTSVSKKSEKLSDAAAAIFVITDEDIRRSGATSIPEVLRMVPGLEVARIDANKWAITSRGFNSRFANMLLVLIDGRSVYTPLYSGVFWDLQDTLLEDVDRIEIIRGPGAALWGANAVNGVINIITKRAKDTQGGLVSAGAGTEERGFGGIRLGGKLSEDAYYRVYTKYFNRDSAVDSSGEDTADDWDMLRGGFRIDWQASDHDSLTLQGDIYNGDMGQTITVVSLTAPYTRTFDETSQKSGGNTLLRWKHVFSESSELALQMYYDRTRFRETIGQEDRDTFDLDLQHQFPSGKWQEFIWGLGYRLTRDDITATFFASSDQNRRDVQIFSAFVQDAVSLSRDRLHFMLGSKFEYNDYTGFEIQPSARVLWTFHKRHSVWTSVSRAIRTPSRSEYDGRLNARVIPPGVSDNPSPLPALVSLIGNRDIDSEELLAYELGYRLQAAENLSIDITTFYNDYDQLSAAESGSPFLEISPAPPHFVVPIFAANNSYAETYGVEIAADYWASDWWYLQTAYTYLKVQIYNSEDRGVSIDSLIKSVRKNNPNHQFSLRSLMDLPGNLEFDTWLRYVDKLLNPNIGSYVTLDARLGWRLRDNFEVSIVGQNLLDNHHPEFVPELIDTSFTEVERSFYGKITWYF